MTQESKHFLVLAEKHGEHTFVNLQLPPGSLNENGIEIFALGFNDMDMTRDDMARELGKALIRLGLQ